MALSADVEQSDTGILTPPGGASTTVAARQWPVAITLVLSALFFCAILLKAKADFDNFSRQDSVAIMGDADILAARANAVLQSAKSALIAGNATGTSAADAIAATGLSGRMLVVGADGAANVSPGLTAAEASAMSAAGEVAGNNGWIGVVSLSAGHIIPVVATKTGDGGLIVVEVDLKSLDLDRPNRTLFLSGPGGQIFWLGGVHQGFDSAQIAASSGFTSLLANNRAGGMASTAVGAQSGKLGLNNGLQMTAAISPVTGEISAGVMRDASHIQAQLMRQGLFYGLLFLGPLLAFAGIFYLVQSQNQRFDELRMAARDAERRLRIAIGAARCGVWDWDLSDDSVFLTKELAKTFGLDGAGRYDASHILAALGDDDQIRLRAALQASARLGTLDLIVKVKSMHGARLLHLRGRAAVDKTQMGSVRALGVAMDVSEQRSAEARLSRAERQLRDAIDALNGPFALWDSGQKLAVWNSGFSEAFGLSDDICVVGADYAHVSAEAAKSVLSVSAAGAQSNAQEIHLANGRWLKLVEQPTSDGGLVSLAVDITEQKENEERLMRSERQTRSVVADLEQSQAAADELAQKYNAARLRAEEASKAKSNFLANMSHELRTPLTAVIGFSEMMKNQVVGPLGNEQYVGYAQSIHESGTHLLALISEVLDMAKIEAGKMEIRPQKVLVDEIVQSAVRMVQNRADQKGVEIEVALGQMGAQLGEAVIDGRAIKQVLINLIGNAVKFTPQGGRVTLQCRGTPTEVMLRVIDTGVGIAPEALPRLGRPFEQVDNDHARAHEGTGLGLAISKSFVDLHSGKLEIQSEPNVGTMVAVILPRNVEKVRNAA